MADHDEITNPMNNIDDEPAVVVGAYSDETNVAYHPIRGALYGLLLGIGVAVYLIILKVISLSLIIPIIVVMLCIALGVAWGRFGPAKQPKAQA